MNREVNAIRIAVLIIVGFGFFHLFENGVFIPLLPAIDITIALLSFLFAIWSWKSERTLSIGSIIFGLGFLGASYSLRDFLSAETFQKFDQNLIFDYLIIFKGLAILAFGILCALKSDKSNSKVCYLVGGIGACSSLLFSAGIEWFLLISIGLCALPTILRWNKFKVPSVWGAFFILELVSVITSKFTI